MSLTMTNTGGGSMMAERITNVAAVASTPAFVWQPYIDTAFSWGLSAMGMAWIGIQIFYKIKNRGK